MWKFLEQGCELLRECSLHLWISSEYSHTKAYGAFLQRVTQHVVALSLLITTPVSKFTSEIFLQFLQPCMLVCTGQYIHAHLSTMIVKFITCVRASSPCPPNEPGLVFGMVVQGRHATRIPSMLTKRLAPSYFAPGTAKCHQLLELTTCLDFVFCIRILSKLTLIVAQILFGEGYFMK